MATVMIPVRRVALFWSPTPFTVISISETISCSPFRAVFVYTSFSDSNICTDTIRSQNKINSLTLVPHITDFETGLHRRMNGMEGKSSLSEVKAASEQWQGSILVMTSTSMREADFLDLLVMPSTTTIRCVIWMDYYTLGKQWWGCGIAPNANGVWEEGQLKPEIQNIINRHPSVFGNPDGIDVLITLLQWDDVGLVRPLLSSVRSWSFSLNNSFCWSFSLISYFNSDFPPGRYDQYSGSEFQLLILMSV